MKTANTITCFLSAIAFTISASAQQAEKGSPITVSKTDDSLPPDERAFIAIPGVTALQAPIQALKGKSRAVKVTPGTMNNRRLRVNLGIGPELDVLRERLAEHPGGRKAWIGRVDGDADSEVIFASSGRAVAGTIRYKGRLFKLQPRPNGRNVLAEVGTADPYLELDPIPAPIQWTGDVLSDATGSGAVQMQAGGATVLDVMVVYTP
jgi:hypothetical protein